MTIEPCQGAPRHFPARSASSAHATCRGRPRCTRICWCTFRPSVPPPRDRRIGVIWRWPVGAHLDAVAAGYESTSVPFVAEGGAAVASIMEFEHGHAMERAEAALRVFEVEAKGAKISYGTRAVRPGLSVRSLRRSAPRPPLRSDGGLPGGAGLRHLRQPAPQESCCRQAGRSCSCPTPSGARSRRLESASAGMGAAARPRPAGCHALLTKADALIAITLKRPDVSARSLAGTTRQAHGARKVCPCAPSRCKPTAATCSRACCRSRPTKSLDLLVMGGYDHSRLQETIFGGVTREMLRSMTVPVLMSH